MKLLSLYTKETEITGNATKQN